MLLKCTTDKSNISYKSYAKIATVEACVKIVIICMSLFASN